MQTIERRFQARLRRHIFHAWRIHLRFLIAPLFVAFSVVDFMYAPELALAWLALRLGFLAFVFAAFELMARSSAIRRRASFLAAAATVLSSAVVSVMIGQTGVEHSLFIPGLILCATTGLQVFKLPRAQALATQCLSYGPVAALLFEHAWRTGTQAPLITVALLAGMGLLTTIFGLSDKDLLWAFMRNGATSREELTRLRRSEYLKAHFPPSLRALIEDGALTLEKQLLLPSALIGFADIASSTQIANHVDLSTDWELKERFLGAASERAAEFDMIVLTHLGDGFLFMANYMRETDWNSSLTGFCDALSSDFDEIRASLADRLGGIDSGLRFGAARGATLIGWLGTQQSYFTAIGPEVNLAARLCQKAKVGELVVSARVWDTLEEKIGDRVAVLASFQLKGFSNSVTAVRVSRREARQLDLVKSA